MSNIAMGSDGLGSGRESVWASSSSNANPPMKCGYPQVLARASEDRVVAVVASLARTRFGSHVPKSSPLFSKLGTSLHQTAIASIGYCCYCDNNPASDNVTKRHQQPT